MTTDLKGKNAVVIGASTGIGRALALALAKQGMNVLVSATNQEKLDSLAAEVESLGVTGLAFACDVSDREQVRALSRYAFQEFGNVYLLCNNAGVTTGGPLIEHDDRDWDWIYDVVLRGVGHAIQAFAPAMVERGEGQIVNTASQAGLVPDWAINHGPYTAAKAGVIAMTTALRAELEPRGVGVSLFIPALVNTDIIKGSSHRRPQRYGGPDPEGNPAMPTLREGVPDPVPGTRFAYEADEAAAIVVQGIKENAPFIVTHGGLKPVVEEYFQRILAAYDVALKREEAAVKADT